jgi:predicted PurR-regulated permease PerM
VKGIALITFVVGVWAVIQARDFLIPIYVAALMSLLMMPVVRLLKRLKMPEALCVGAASLLMILPLLGVASIVIREIRSLSSNWPILRNTLEDKLDHVMATPWIANLHLTDQFSIADLAKAIAQKAGESVNLVFTGLSMLFSAGSQISLILFFAIMMIVSRVHLRESFKKILVQMAGPSSVSLVHESLQILEQFLAARLLIILVVGVTDVVILSLFNVQYGVTLGIIQGIMTLIPVVGFVAGMIPVVLIALSQGLPTLAMIGLLVALWVVSSLQDHFMTPKLIGQRLNLNFFVTYVALFAGERMWGIWGMFLAIPTLGVLRVIFNASPELKIWSHLIQERTAEKSEG